ncbi:MAG: outer membrane protein transport protein [Ignavibacteria bacterium]|nr:outer membrane protein transport protein [Ignavibacteria bacterium]
MKPNTSILIFLLIFLLNTFIIAGDANFNSASRAKTLSLNGLYFAGADGLQPVLGNPSTLSLLNSRGIEFFIIDHIGQHKFENLQNNLFQSFQDDDFSFGGGAYWSFSHSFTAALSYQRAIDYKVSWPFTNLFSNDSSSSLLAFDFYNQITIDAASASFAFKFDQVSVGGSANFYYVAQHTSFPRSNERWNQGSGLAAYQFNYNLDGYSFGFNLGASFQVIDQIGAGIMTRSGYKVDLEGTAESSMFAQLDSSSSLVNLSGNFEMPWVFGGGIVYEWTDDLIINLDMQYNLWNGIQKTFDFTFDNSSWQQNLSSIDSLTTITAASFTLSFDNSIDAGLGIEYKTSDLVLRTGYRFSQSPNTDDTYNMLFPSVDQHWVSIGIGYQKENLLIDAAIAYAFGIAKEVMKPGIRNLSGSYSSTMIMPNVTIRYLL